MSRPFHRRKLDAVVLFGAFFVLVVFVVWGGLSWLVLTPHPLSPFLAVPRRERVRLLVELSAALLGGSTLCLAGLAVIGKRRVLPRVLLVASLPLVITFSSLTWGRHQKIQVSPHVLLLTLDGLDADRMALYGSTRITTPFLDRLGAHSLVAANFFPQSCCTSSGTLALISGQVPLELRVLYPPHQLEQRHQYRNLPALLRGR